MGGHPRPAAARRGLTHQAVKVPVIVVDWWFVIVPEDSGKKTERPWTFKSLHPLPVVAVRLMRLIASDEVMFQRVADLIRSDVSFSAEVLRVANSPLIGRREEIRGIMHAIALLGLERLKGLVMTVALRNFLAPTLHMPALLRCWRHSLACAAIAEELAVANFLERDRHYTLGLLHDLGRLAIAATYPADYAHLLEEADLAAPGEARLLERERERFGTDHAQVGQWLAEDWGFPPEYRDAAGTHHEQHPDVEFTSRTAIHLSCRIADVLGFQVAGPAPVETLDEIKAQYKHCSWDRVKPEPQLLLAVASRVNALECSLL